MTLFQRTFFQRRDQHILERHLFTFYITENIFYNTIIAHIKKHWHTGVFMDDENQRYVRTKHSTNLHNIVQHILIITTRILCKYNSIISTK